MSESMGKYSRGKKRSKVDSLMPVDADFWSQFAREFGMSRYIYNLYSEYRWAMHIADLAEKLMEYMSIMDSAEEKLDSKLVEVVEKIPDCLKNLDYWLFHCLEVPMVGGNGNAIVDRMGRVVKRDIGFYHLRRQNLFPIGAEMFVLVEGFTTPITNENYSSMRKIALNGEIGESGRYEGGTKRVVLKIESIFHRVLELAKNKPYKFKPEKLLIGDEVEAKELDEEEAQLYDVSAMMKELRQTYGDEVVGDDDSEEYEEK